MQTKKIMQKQDRYIKKLQAKMWASFTEIVKIWFKSL